ncbi:PREDICTED: uncharacterized protein LOC104709805 [Camelina sativa]|uniref:Uncharacterized protein LOC104709805 n=1 Tax=Camelina sativa TaxID=90675 RepID=A0ABM0TDC6_CAMSA|nr:PREDICTED: uncharacterized protein LOC104709805 [Camelina sativa]
MCLIAPYYSGNRRSITIFIFQTLLRANPPPLAPTTATREAPETPTEVENPEDCGPFQIHDAGIGQGDLTDTAGRRCDKDAGARNVVSPHCRLDEDSSRNLPYSEDTNQQRRSCEVAAPPNVQPSSYCNSPNKAAPSGIGGPLMDHRPNSMSGDNIVMSSRSVEDADTDSEQDSGNFVPSDAQVPVYSPLLLFSSQSACPSTTTEGDLCMTFMYSGGLFMLSISFWFTFVMLSISFSLGTYKHSQPFVHLPFVVSINLFMSTFNVICLSFGCFKRSFFQDNHL